MKPNGVWIEIVLLGTAMACALALLIATLGAAAGAATAAAASRIKYVVFISHLNKDRAAMMPHRTLQRQPPIGIPGIWKV